MIDAPMINSLAPDSSPLSDNVADGVTRNNMVRLSGTASPFSIVSLFDGASLLGMAKTDTRGAWKFFTGTLPNGIHSFTASATDADGNTSGVSTAIKVVIDAQDLVVPALASLFHDEADSFTSKFMHASGAASAALGTIDAPASTLGGVSATVSDALHVQSLDGDAHAGDTTGSAVDPASTVTVAEGTSSFTIATPVGTEPVAEPVSNVTSVIPDGATLELAYAYSGTVSFAGDTGTLIIDHSSSFGGTINGQLGIGNIIDLADITGGASSTIAYSGNYSPGTLTVSDGTHTVNIALEGNYSLANFTAYSDGHGGTIVIDPPIVQVAYSLREIDGGQNYFAQFSHSLPTDPSFFPVGAWFESVITQQDINLDKAAGLNFYDAITANSNLSLVQSNGMYVIAQQDEWQTSAGINSAANVGWLLGDEIDMFLGPNQGYTELNNIVASLPNDGRFIYNNFGKGVIFWETDAQAARFVNSVDVVSADTYWFTDPNISGISEGGALLNNGHSLTVAQTELAANYGYTIDRLRELDASDGVLHPVWGFVELGWPFTESAAQGGRAITPDEIKAAVWQEIIAGARGIIYFNHSFGGPAQTQNVLHDPYYATELAAVTQTDALINQLAPILNSPFDDAFVTVNSSVRAMAKYYGGEHYVFAGSTQHAASTDTFTLAGITSGTAMVIGENRTITITNGQFVDNFADGNAIHIYHIIANGTQTALGAPTIASFSTDSGTVGDHITSDSTLALAGTAEANSMVKIYDGNKLLGTTTANGNGAWSYTTPAALALSDGVHNLTATATDTTGNTSAASASLNVTIDTAAPSSPAIASFSTDSGTVGDHITNDSTLVLTGTAEANSRVTVSDGTKMLGTTTASGNGAWSYTTPTALALSDGVHNLTANATDAAGNKSAASAALSVTVDTVAPNKPVISTDIVNANNNTVALTGTAEANSRVAVSDGTKVLGTTTANGNGAWSYTTAALGNGIHNLTATATDAAGNTSAPSQAVDPVIDSAQPAAPAITSFSTDSGTIGDHITNDSTLALVGAAETNSTVKIYDGTKLLGTTTANGNGAWSYTTPTAMALSDGIHNLTATATDAGGNTSAASAALAVTIDTVAPMAPIIVADSVNSNDTVFLTGTAEANSTINVYDEANLVGTAYVNGNGDWSSTTTALSNGAHNLIATATDVAGNTSVASQPVDPVIGSVVPAAPSIVSFSTDSGTIGDHITNDSTLTLAGKAEANCTVMVCDGTTVLGTTTANGNGAWSYTTPTALAVSDGVHNLTATATDAAGNTSAASAVLSVTVDTVAPSEPVITADAINANNTVALKGTAEAQSTVKVYDDTSLLGTTTADKNGAWSYTTAALVAGDHSMTATATDAAGNASAASTAMSVTIAAPPAIQHGHHHYFGHHGHTSSYNYFTWDSTAPLSSSSTTTSGLNVADTSVTPQVAGTDISSSVNGDPLQGQNAYTDLAKELADASQACLGAVIAADMHHHSGNFHHSMIYQLTKHDFHSV